MIGAFTGTQRGMKVPQWNTLRKLVALRQKGEFELTPLTEWHHGDCIGADAQSHELALFHHIPVHLHPMTPDLKRAFCLRATVTHQPKPPLERNIDMVNVSRILYATPRQTYNVPRGSGTWHAIRQGVKKMRMDPEYQVIIIFPDGTLADPLRIVY
jgi:hypothetical protein